MPTEKPTLNELGRNQENQENRKILPLDKGDSDFVETAPEDGSAFSEVGRGNRNKEVNGREALPNVSPSDSAKEVLTDGPLGGPLRGVKNEDKIEEIFNKYQVDGEPVINSKGELVDGALDRLNELLGSK